MYAYIYIEREREMYVLSYSKHVYIISWYFISHYLGV